MLRGFSLGSRRWNGPWRRVAWLVAGAPVALAGGSAKASEPDEPIVVTGTRIRQPEVAGTEPTTTTTAQYADDRNLTNIADALNEIPGYRGSVTLASNQATFG